MPNKTRATKGTGQAKAKVTTTVQASQISLSGVATVRYRENQMYEVELALDGVLRPLVLAILEPDMEMDAVRFECPRQTLVTEICGDDAADVVREIGLHIARAGGFRPVSREQLL